VVLILFDLSWVAYPGRKRARNSGEVIEIEEYSVAEAEEWSEYFVILSWNWTFYGCIYTGVKQFMQTFKGTLYAVSI